MKIKLICLGKTSKPFLIAGIEEYTKRLKRYIPFEIVEIPDVKNIRSRSIEEIKELEAKSILSKIKENNYVILLDEKGKEFNSEGFAGYLQEHFNSGKQTLLFVIGGSYGFGHEVYKRADQQISLSKLTFSHQMVRLFFIEQLYRGLTIINNEPYHHSS